MKKNNKGFTLAELLIVVAIIAVLVAIAIPVFTTQLERSRESTDMANVRSAYATLVTNYLTDTSASGSTIAVAANQTVASWQTSGAGFIEYMNNDGASQYSYSAVTAPNSFTVGISVRSTDGAVFPAVSQGS